MRVTAPMFAHALRKTNKPRAENAHDPSVSFSFNFASVMTNSAGIPYSDVEKRPLRNSGSSLRRRASCLDCRGEGEAEVLRDSRSFREIK